MPPLASWFGPKPEFEDFLRRFPMSGQIKWKMIPTTANGQPAFGAYAYDPEQDAYLAFALNVLTLRGDKICDEIAFAVKEIDAEAAERYHRWDTEGTDEARLRSTFARFGLPERI
jgi:RNA polymerase sigma-70 factor (ECF subfamily)